MAIAYITDNTNLNGFRVDYLSNIKITNNATISEYTLEDGSIINDHRTIAPLEISFSGVISDAQQITHYVPPATGVATFDKLINFVTSKANAIKDNLLAYNMRFNSVFNALSINNKLNGRRDKYNALLQLFKNNNQLLTLTTDLGVYDNLVITALSVVRDDKDSFYTLNITLKQVKFATTQTLLTSSLLPNIKAKKGMNQTFSNVIAKAKQTPVNSTSTTVAPLKQNPSNWAFVDALQQDTAQKRKELQELQR